MKMLIEGKLIDKNEKIAVKNPFNNEIIDYVPSGDTDDVKKLFLPRLKQRSP
jgi:acyl-CoA reductase-like NAD-dependent aldehyde dehydrogenase